MKDPHLHSNWTGRVPRTAHEAFGFDAPIAEPDPNVAAVLAFLTYLTKAALVMFVLGLTVLVWWLA